MSLVYMQDDYAVQSFERGISAQEAGAFKWEIVPVNIIRAWSLDIVPYSKKASSSQSFYFLVIMNCDNVQVEVPGGRGKPSIIVDKDDGLGKVSTFMTFY